MQFTFPWVRTDELLSDDLPVPGRLQVLLVLKYFQRPPVRYGPPRDPLITCPPVFFREINEEKTQTLLVILISIAPARPFGSQPAAANESALWLPLMDKRALKSVSYYTKRTQSSHRV